MWTIQSKEAWEVFQEKGILQGDGRRVYKDFRPAYHWMMEQMKKRLPGYKGGFPIWAWAQKPDLRSSGFLTKGRSGVRIEFWADAERVLFSDFHAWHMVLNNWYLALSEQEETEWEILSRQFSKNDDCLKRLLEQSWERIFDLELLCRTGLFGTELTVQGVLEEIPLHDVIRVKEFISK